MNRNMCDIVIASWHRHRQSGDSEPRRSAATDHLRSCEHCQSMVAQQSRLSSLANEVQMDPILERRLDVAIGARELPRPRRFFTTRSKTALAMATAACIAVGLVFVWRVNEPVQNAVQRSVSEPPRASLSESAPVIRAETNDRTLELRSGSTVWLKTGTAVQMLSDTKRLVKARLKRGRLVTRIGPQEKGFRFVVDTPSARVVALGTVFSVEVAGNGRETIRVSESAVQVVDRNTGERHTVSAGQEFVLGDRAPKVASKTAVEKDLLAVNAVEQEDESAASDPITSSPPTARSSKVASRKVTEDLRKLAHTAIAQRRFSDAEWIIDQIRSKLMPADKIDLFVRLARAYRQARQYEAAARTYQRLGKAFPNSAAAMNGLVTLAQIERRSLHDPKTAIVHFDLYLKKRPYGFLAEAARVGKVRALYTLGKWKSVKAASDEYLQAHYGGLSTKEVQRKRDHAVRQLGDS